MLKFIKGYWHVLAIILIIVLLVFFRLTSYGDPRLSIGTNDSSSYYEQTNVPTFSWEALTVRRLPSYVLLFKMFEPEDGYKLEAVSYPAAPDAGTSEKQLQPGFDKVVVTQMWLSITAWVFFALMIARHLRNRIIKILAVVFILMFAFLPPIAEWDSILMSESGSYSLFMLMLGFSIEIISRILKEGRKASWLTIFLWAAWFIVFILWAFMRDSNATIMLIVVGILLALIIIPATRKRLPLGLFGGTAVVLLVLFLIFAAAASQSGRWLGSWDGLYNGYIAPYKTHLQFFHDHGMPETTSEARVWAAENGAKTYLLMLLKFPRFAVNTFLFLMQPVFSENIQPFFFTVPTSGYRNLVALGNIFHPLSSAPFLLSLITGVLVAAAAFNRQKTEKTTWAWMAIWMLVLVFCYYGLAFFADAAGIIRHLQGASMPMRLMIWLFPLVLGDYSLRSSS
jgi:hypothetical protein